MAPKLKDPKFHRQYSKEAMKIAAVLPGLCESSASAMMSLMVVACSVGLTVTEHDHDRAKAVVNEAVNYIFSRWKQNLPITSQEMEILEMKLRGFAG